jgi:hypothetical protein
VPRKKLTEEEIDDLQERGRAREVYFTSHPEERSRLHAEQHAKHRRAADKRLRKHQPVVTDISFNGEYVTVAYVRNNGEKVVALYKRYGWNMPPVSEWNRKERRALEKIRAEEQVPGTLPPDPARTPRS